MQMQRLKLSPEKKKAEQDKKSLYMKRCHEAESTHKAATQKNNDNASKKRKCQNESTDAAATQKNNNNASKKRRCQCQQQNFNTMSHDEEISHAIKRAMKEAKQILHRTQNPTNHQCIGQLYASYVIGSLLVQRKFTNFQATRFLNTPIDSLLKPTELTMGLS